MVLFLFVLVGGLAVSIDVGAWYRQSRQAQVAADAAALSAAQALPTDPGQALALAQSYATDNGGGVDASDVTFSTAFLPNDTVTVKATQTAPGFFSKLFGIDHVTVHAQASARAGIPSQAFGVAPIVVNKLNPQLAGPGCPCFNVPATLPLGKTGAPGAFDLVNLDTSTTSGTIGSSTLAGWIQDGFQQNLPLGDYFSDEGAKWNDGPIQSALQGRIGTELLFPVYDTLAGSGSNATYHVIGWVGFMVQGETANGASGSLTGYFTRVIWKGILSTTDPGIPDYGVYSVALVN
jgi:hypothetical protein